MPADNAFFGAQEIDRPLVFHSPTKPQNALPVGASPHVFFSTEVEPSVENFSLSVKFSPQVFHGLWNSAFPAPSGCENPGVLHRGSGVRRWIFAQMDGLAVYNYQFHHRLCIFVHKTFTDCG